MFFTNFGNEGKKEFLLILERPESQTRLYEETIRVVLFEINFTPPRRNPSTAKQTTMRSTFASSW